MTRIELIVKKLLEEIAVKCVTGGVGSQRCIGVVPADVPLGSDLGLPDHLERFQGYYVFQRDTVGYFCEDLQGGGRNGHSAPWKL